MIGLSGCTIYGVKNPPTLKTTTSAEQYERIFWSAVKAKTGGRLPGMLAANRDVQRWWQGSQQRSGGAISAGAQSHRFHHHRDGGQAKRPGHEPELHLAALLGRGIAPDLHGTQRLATSSQRLDPHRPHRASANASNSEYCPSLIVEFHHNRAQGAPPLARFASRCGIPASVDHSALRCIRAKPRDLRSHRTTLGGPASFGSTRSVAMRRSVGFTPSDTFEDVVIRPAAIRKFQRELLAWFDSHARDLPWRRSADPYRIWVSEIMLQQTRVTAVLDYYARFLALFPSVAALAQAEEPAVLAAWSGLGYYRRAKLMHKAAQVVVQEHQGVLPAPPRNCASCRESESTPPRPSPASPSASRSRSSTATSSGSCCVSFPRTKSPQPRRNGCATVPPACSIPSVLETSTRR